MTFPAVSPAGAETPQRKIQWVFLRLTSHVKSNSGPTCPLFWRLFRG